MNTSIFDRTGFWLIALPATIILIGLLVLLIGKSDSPVNANASEHALHTGAAMIGDEVQAPGGPHDLDALTYPKPAEPYRPGRIRNFELNVTESNIEIADGVTFPAWTFNGSAPGPVLRATEGDIVRVTLVNKTSQPHSFHTHGIHPSDQDGVFEQVQPGDKYTYEFVAGPAGVQVYHCHSMPLKKHIHKGLYGMFIIDPKQARPPAKEIAMVMNGFDTDGDGANNFYTVNGKAMYFSKYPINVKQGERVRVYLANMTEFDLLNSMHLHGNFFRYYPTGFMNPPQYTDMIAQAQGERGIVETAFPYTGNYMFHAHQSEFADLGWMGFFHVTRDKRIPKGLPGPDTEQAFGPATQLPVSTYTYPSIKTVGDQ
jgi:FtsP/CotA-like multicopper oxidase with cupredoxin domain